MPLKNESGQLIAKETQKVARIVKNQMKPTHVPPIPTLANGSCLEGNVWNMEEIGRRTKLGKLVGESRVGCHFADFPQGKNYCGGIGGAWHP